MKLHGYTIPDNDLTIISIDPGSNMCGFSVIRYNFESKKYHIEFCDTLNGQQIANNYYDKTERESIGDRLTRNLSYGRKLTIMLNQFKPSAVISESPFMGRFAKAFEALVEQVTMFKATVYNFDRSLEFSFLSPTEVKKGMDTKGNSKDKTLMKEALLKRTDIVWHDIDPLTLDEHSVDATCVGLVAIKMLVAFLHQFMESQHETIK